VYGSHIYIRPSGEHRFTTLDDLSETSLALALLYAIGAVEMNGELIRSARA
jgi:hypothetical protein